MLLRYLENKHIYHPERAQPVDLGSYGLEDLLIDSTDEQIRAKFKQQDDRYLLLIAHGNASSLESMSDIYSMQLALGYSFLAFEYPGYGLTPGEPSEAGLYRSLEEVYHFIISEKGYRPEQIVLYGISLGGAVVLYGCTKFKARCAVIESSFTSVRDMSRFCYPYIPLHLLVSRQFSSLDRVKQVTLPLLFAHGTADTTIPYQHSVRMYAAANEPKFIHLMQGAGHRDYHSADNEDYLQVLRNFIEQKHVQGGGDLQLN